MYTFSIHTTHAHTHSNLDDVRREDAILEEVHLLLVLFALLYGRKVRGKDPSEMCWVNAPFYAHKIDTREEICKTFPLEHAT